VPTDRAPIDPERVLVIVAVYLVVGCGVGLFGSLVGLGGGIFLVPALSLFLGVPIHVAIATSLVAVIATSSSAAVGYLRHDLSNIRLGMVLETATTVGSIVGGLVATALNREVLSGIFGVVLAAVAIYMLVKRGGEPAARANIVPGGRLDGRIGGHYHDVRRGEDIGYSVRRVPFGLAASFVAGNLSGLLGIGGGVVKVPAMTLAMGVPPKVAVATSNFMIGVTACAGAFIYYSRGYIDPRVAAPIVLGVTVGAYVGSRLTPRIKSSHLLLALAVVMLLLAGQMLLAAVGIRVR
jgi:Predicted permeases